MGRDNKSESTDCHPIPHLPRVLGHWTQNVDSSCWKIWITVLDTESYGSNSLPCCLCSVEDTCLNTLHQCLNSLHQCLKTVPWFILQRSRRLMGSVREEGSEGVLSLWYPWNSILAVPHYWDLFDMYESSLFNFSYLMPKNKNISNFIEIVRRGVIHCKWMSGVIRT